MTEINGTWDEEIKEVLVAKLKEEGFGTTDENILELLRESTIHEEIDASHRWWNDVLKVAKIGKQLIGFVDGDNTGDTSLNDLGWTFYADTVTFYEQYEVTVTKYRPKSSSTK